MKRRVLIGLAAAAVLVTMSVGVGFAFDALLVNPGAEDPLAPDWVVIDGNFDRVQSGGGGLIWPESGSWMFWAGPQADYSALQQGINVAGYGTFCAGGWMFTHAGALADDEAQIRVDFYDGGSHIMEYKTGWTTTADTWQHHEMCGDVPPNADLADFTLQGYLQQPWDIHAYFDSLYFDAWVAEDDFVPEWGSVALLGSGLAGMAGYATLRLRKRQ